MLCVRRKTGLHIRVSVRPEDKTCIFSWRGVATMLDIKKSLAVKHDCESRHVTLDKDGLRHPDCHSYMDDSDIVWFPHQSTITAIMWEPKSDPWTLACKHRFCHTCLVDEKGMTKVTTCPLCPERHHSMR